MRRAILFSLIAILWLAFLSIGECQCRCVEELVPYIPSPQAVHLKFQELNGTSYVIVSITFSDGGFGVSDWGEIRRDGNGIWVNSEIWEWTGYSIQIIIAVTNTYNLGRLEEGDYTFTFMCWDYHVKTLDFTVVAVDVPTVDLDNNGFIDIVDLAIAARAFGSRHGSTNWNPTADLNQDGIVNIEDLTQISFHFGETW